MSDYQKHFTAGNCRASPYHSVQLRPASLPQSTAINSCLVHWQPSINTFIRRHRAKMICITVNPWWHGWKHAALQHTDIGPGKGNGADNIILHLCRYASSIQTRQQNSIILISLAEPTSTLCLCLLRDTSFPCNPSKWTQRILFRKWQHPPDELQWRDARAPLSLCMFDIQCSHGQELPISPFPRWGPICTPRSQRDSAIRAAGR